MSCSPAPRRTRQRRNYLSFTFCARLYAIVMSSFLLLLSNPLASSRYRSCLHPVVRWQEQCTLDFLLFLVNLPCIPLLFLIVSRGSFHLRLDISEQEAPRSVVLCCHEVNASLTAPLLPVPISVPTCIASCSREVLNFLLCDLGGSESIPRNSSLTVAVKPGRPAMHVSFGCVPSAASTTQTTYHAT
jgi:hypothetical protein